VIEQDGDDLVVRFCSGGLREIAEHLFTWGGAVRIEAPDELRAVMRERLSAASQSVV
jgi:predicted DNA-binding transcriptional regulator YafY